MLGRHLMKLGGAEWMARPHREALRSFPSFIAWAPASTLSRGIENKAPLAWVMGPQMCGCPQAWDRWVSDYPAGAGCRLRGGAPHSRTGAILTEEQGKAGCWDHLEGRPPHLPQGLRLRSCPGSLADTPLLISSLPGQRPQ